MSFDRSTLIPGTSVVRIVSNKLSIPAALLANVLTVAPIEPEHLGSDGEPTISVAYLDPRTVNEATLGKIDWHTMFVRESGVRHISHPDFTEHKTSIGWVDVIPVEMLGEDLDLYELFGMEKPSEPVAAAPAEPAAPEEAPAAPTPYENYGLRVVPGTEAGSGFNVVHVASGAILANRSTEEAARAYVDQQPERDKINEQLNLTGKVPTPVPTPEAPTEPTPVETPTEPVAAATTEEATTEEEKPAEEAAHS